MKIATLSSPIVSFAYTIFLIMLSFSICAQTTLINNKGNRNQSYPIIIDPKPEIVQLINQVNQNNIENSIKYMQQFWRIATSPAALTVQNWLVNKFETYGYDANEDISIHYFTMNSQQLDAGNVVVIKKGTEYPDEYIMITSHYDHSSWDNPSGPGADDNASGTSGVLECARLLKNFSTKRSIMFVPFNAEEYWMVGSFPFAKKCASENLNIIAHFNMDMIGWFPPGNSNTLMASGYSYISRALFDYYQQVANTYIPSIPTIRLSAGDSYGGDHMSFNIYEYPSLYIGDIEYHTLHPCYHKPCDTIGPYQVGINCGVNRLDLARNFVQATLCAVAELANAWLPPQNLSACSGEMKITVSWDTDNESSFYKIFRNNSLIGETVESFYVDNSVESGKKYEYYVVAVNAANGKESAPSNKDAIIFVEPLQLPYSNNFSENKKGFQQSDWTIRTHNGKTSLCNNSGSGYFSDNYLSIAELDWFQIPSNTEKIFIRFKWTGSLNGIWNNTGLFFEVTTDRKVWHKLAYISGNNSNWNNYEFSLKQYVNNEFFQVRFRLESSGSNEYSYTKLGFITDIEIDRVQGQDTVPKDTIPNDNIQDDTLSIRNFTSYISIFTFSPNPANEFINIETNQQEPYHIAIYDLTGKILYSQDSFNNGILSVSNLRKGIYIIVASTKHHRVAKKLVIL